MVKVVDSPENLPPPYGHGSGCRMFRARRELEALELAAFQPCAHRSQLTRPILFSFRQAFTGPHT